jgi:hypothetical protein
MSQGSVLPAAMRTTYDNWCFASGVRHEATVRARKEREKESQPSSPETHAQRRKSRLLDVNNRSSDPAPDRALFSDCSKKIDEDQRGN